MSGSIGPAVLSRRAGRLIGARRGRLRGGGRLVQLVGFRCFGLRRLGHLRQHLWWLAGLRRAVARLGRRERRARGARH